MIPQLAGKACSTDDVQISVKLIAPPLYVFLTQSLSKEAALEAVNDAILETTRNRIRPIFMSTLTSVIGMLPLVVFPGSGSELYRGLGSVVVGGLSMSAVLTLLLVPPLLRLALSVSRSAVAVPA